MLSLCFGLLTPLGASAQQAPAAPTPDAPADAPAAEAPAADAPTGDAPVADVPATPAAPAEEEQAAPAPAPAEEPPYPVAEQPAPAPVAAPAPPAVQGAISVDTHDKSSDSPADTGEKKVADEERCAQLMAQGQTALAQAEGCGGGDAPRWAGTIVSLTENTAPAYRTLPNANNPYAAMNLYVAPRIALTDKWALLADFSITHEQTKPDDAVRRNYVWRSDTRVTAQGNLFTVGGVTFTGGPRLTLPTSQFSVAAKTILGAGFTLNAVKQFEVLDGLAFTAGGAYAHTFSRALTRQITDGDAPKCTQLTGESADCSAGSTRVVQDNVRAVAGASLNFTPAWNLQAAYLYSWSLVKPWKSDTVDISTLGGTSTVDLSQGVLPDNRWRRLGYLQVALSYQPTTWFIGTLQMQTGVCYDASSGSQSSTGGCGAGQKSSDFWLRNPVANKFTNLGLQMTVPIDALYARLKKKGPDEKRTARLRALQKKL